MFKVSRELLISENIQSVINFGVSYAYFDHKLAEEFPEIKFYGVERTCAANLYNNTFLPPLNNLKIIQSDIFDALEKLDLENSLLVTARTLLLLPNHLFFKTL